jgi:uncharacterized protein
MHYLLLLLAALGHAFVWIGLVNRLHALGLRRWIISLLTVTMFLCAALIPVAVGWRLVQQGGRDLAPAAGVDIGALLIDLYLIACWIVAPVTLLRAAALRFRRVPPIVRFHRRRPATIDPAPAAALAEEVRHHSLARLPLNEILRLTVVDWTLDVPRLPPALDGLSIVHLTDLHLSGRIGKAYYREVVRIANGLEPDLVAVTGDILEKPACLPWIADTLGRLSAPAGVYFVLGNHDLVAMQEGGLAPSGTPKTPPERSAASRLSPFFQAVDARPLRQALEQCGLIDLGGRWRQIEFRGTPIVLLGNERPWGATAADLKDAPPPAPAGPVRIALAHTPDQLGWAVRHDVDLLLTGHTHGGQICLPLLGPIFSPTLHGVKYIGGVYYVPPTILHASRGISGDAPVRWRCPPEIARIRLRVG